MSDVTQVVMGEKRTYVLTEDVLRELREVFQGKSFVEPAQQPEKISSLKQLWELLEERNDGGTQYHGVQSIQRR